MEGGPAGLRDYQGEMDHTFLVDEGHWRAVGRFKGRDGSDLELDGDAEVHHVPEGWELRARLSVGRARLELQFEVVPWRRDADDTRWSLVQPDDPRLEGVIVGVADDLLVRYAGRSPDLQGVAVLRQVAEHRYQGRGARYVDGALSGTWSLELVRGTW